MTAQSTRLRCSSRIAMSAWLCALLLWLSGMLPVANACDAEAETAEQVISQIRLGEWRDDLPPGVSLVVTGGSMIRRSFPALSADRSQIALLYYAGHPMRQGYPTFEIHSTSTLALLDRIELVAGTDGDRSDLRNADVLAEIESVLARINGRLREGAFHPMSTLFELPPYGPLEGVERFGKRIDYSRTIDDPWLVIRSAESRHVELRMRMPSELIPSGRGPGDLCEQGGHPGQAWYDPALRIMVLRVSYTSSADGCEAPEEWHLKRLGAS